MNIFLPEETITDSIISLDNKRLNKQIYECKAILNVALYNSKGYANHPVVKYYKDYPWFVVIYGTICCAEYAYRHDYKIRHPMYETFLSLQNEMKKMNIADKGEVKPFYSEGIITDPNHIRTFDDTVELFRDKLCNKWNNDKSPPHWTNREPPIWYMKEDK